MYCRMLHYRNIAGLHKADCKMFNVSYEYFIKFYFLTLDHHQKMWIWYAHDFFASGMLYVR